MFLLRSAFWLSAAFIVMAPTVGMDVGEAARSTSQQLVSQGAKTVGETLLPAHCETMECIVGRTVLDQVAAAPASTGTETAASPGGSVRAERNVPFPPPRPVWAY